MSTRTPHRSRKPASRVPDVIAPDLDALFIGINPGLVSAREGHHFANPANPFWRLLHESGLVPRRLSPAEEHELLALRMGITNLVARETAGASELTRQDFEEGVDILARKIRRYKPRAIVFVGLTAYAAFERGMRARSTEARAARGRIACGEQPERFAGARVFVVPSPSGRNAHFTHDRMLSAFTEVAKALGRR